MILRNDQLEALREALEKPTPWDRARRMVVDLEDLGYFETGGSELRDLLGDFRRRRALPADLPAPETLLHLVAERIQAGDRLGIATDLLLLRFVGFTFRHGLDWDRRETVKVILESDLLNEETKLLQVEGVLRRR